MTQGALDFDRQLPVEVSNGIQEVAQSQRLIAIDMLRGIALILMLLDHTAFFAHVGILAEAYNGERPILEGMAHTLTGLFTNIATPIFVILAGTSVAFLENSFRKKRHSEWKISRFLLIRATILFIFDAILVYLIYNTSVTLSVLSAVGFALVMLAAIRLLPLKVIVIIGLVILLSYPLLWKMLPFTPSSLPNPVVKILMYSETTSQPRVQYPLMGWPVLSLFGYVGGRLLLSKKFVLSPKIIRVAGWGLLVCFILRLAGGYGNFVPYTADQPLIYFLIEDKQPPSLVYILWNTSLALLILTLILYFEQRLQKMFIGKLLITFGQTSLFFYVVHLSVLRLGTHVFPFDTVISKGLVRGYTEFLLVLVLMYPLCIMYRRLRQRYPDSWLRYL